MNCIDHLQTPILNRRHIGLTCFILAATALMVFTAMTIGATTPAKAGPQFSIPGLNALQRKFQKKRRRRRGRQREDFDEQNSPERYVPSAPPPLPVRNPRHAETEKQLSNLSIQEPAGKRTALKAELVLRNKRAATNRKASTSEKTGANKPEGKKAAGSVIKPTRWSRPQNTSTKPLRGQPAADPQASKTLATNKLLPSPDSMTDDMPAPDLRSFDKLAVVLPPLPIRKPRRHPSQVIEEDWTEAVIASATAQCATLGIEIKPLPPIKKGLCGNPAPVLLPVIGAATVRPAATLSCPLAANLARWLSQSVQPLALKHFGEKVQQIRNVSSYVCRNRYGDTNTRISEHAYANALDIAHFELQSGQKVSVLNDWDKIEGQPNQKSAFLHAVHKSACQWFGTVLGPNANAAHKDHFHLDQAPRKRSNYCR